MENQYQDEMVCDLAEYYHIYNYKSFPMEYISTLCCGLPAESRTLKKINGMKCSTEELMLINIVDKLSLIWWSKTKDGQKNRNRPKLICEIMQEKEESKNRIAFNSPEEFEAMRRKIIEGKKKHG